jgi:UDP-N-acetylglucosamine:LPS N-acetylglucosamine transferase
VHLSQASLTGEALWRRALEVAGDPTHLTAMRVAARGVATPHAAQEIAAQLERLLPPRRQRANGLDEGQESLR